MFLLGNKFDVKYDSIKRQMGKDFYSGVSFCFNFMMNKEFRLIDQIMKNLQRMGLRILTDEGYIIDITEKCCPDFSI
jgi:hypothetical protein